MATLQTIADADLARLPRDGRKYELVDGAVRVSPAGYRHGEVIVELTGRLWAFARAHGLGRVLDSSTGFRLQGGNVRSPDVSFVARHRQPAAPSPEGFAEFPPDLVAEVLSPEDSPRDVMEKVGEYLGAGVRLVWVIDPRARRAVAYRSLTDVREIPEDGSLDGEDVVPGFACTLKELLES